MKPTATIAHEFTQRNCHYRIVRKQGLVVWYVLERTFGCDEMGQPSWRYCDPTEASYELFEELARVVSGK